MKVYLVGGAVRDQLLNLPVKEKDWVVVGATVDEMVKQGFVQVGKDFPVFLHPKTREEYALARRERKIGKGYTGFDFDASAEVSLEEDLLRRDLTINAMAQSPMGELIDPYHGKKDLEKKLLRHVSPAFIEDPVRILRVARFAARYANLGFRVAPETMDLMKSMVVGGEVNALVAERVWKEFERALSEPRPEQFFKVLADCGALAILFPAVRIGGYGVTALMQASQLASNMVIRFAALLHDLSIAQIQDICKAYRIPAAYKELALLVVQYSAIYLHARKLQAKQILELLQKTDAFRRETRFNNFLISCQAIAQMLAAESGQAAWLQQALVVCQAINTKELAQLNLSGKAIADHLNQLRLAAVQSLVNKS